MSVIYGLRAVDSEEYFYIGSTKYAAEKRLGDHLSEIRNETKTNRHFVNKANKIGLDRIVVDVLEETTREQQFEREKWWIQDLLGKGIKLVNRVYVDFLPPYREELPPITEEQWDQAFEFYHQYKHGKRWAAENPENEGIFQALSETLFLIVGKVLDQTDGKGPFVENSE